MKTSISPDIFVIQLKFSGLYFSKEYEDSNSLMTPPVHALTFA
jgi:hypothetical protein